VLLEQKSGWFGHPRFSPDGRLIAYENHPLLGNDTGSVEVVDLSGKRKVLSAYESGLEGIAWGPDGREVWYAGTATSGWADTVYAVSLTGKQRAILTMPYLRLHDVAKDGRALVSHETWRSQLIGFFPGDKAEHPFSWLDATNATAITANGGIISFREAGEIYGIFHDFMAYYRSTDGSPAVFWGPGVAVISPDGRWLLMTSAKSHKLELQPVGPGTPRELPTPGLVNFDHQSWSGDGRVVAYEAETDRNEWGVYRQRISGGGPPTLVKTEGRDGHPILSSDGSMLAVHVDGAGVSLYRADSAQPAPLKGGLPDQYAMRFTADGRALLVAESSEKETVFTLVDLASGRRQLWKRLPTNARTGSWGLVVTPDLKYYAYSSPRFASDLYIVENLR
jgi:WD40-like Beta Propeller Repeat